MDKKKNLKVAYTTLLEKYPTLFGEKPDSCGLPGSLHSLRILAVPQTRGHWKESNFRQERTLWKYMIELIATSL